MTHVPPAVAEKMDKFFLVSQEKDNLARKLETAKSDGRDNLAIVYRRLMEKAERNLILLRAEIEHLDICAACDSRSWAE
jgi:hypothetical protein